MSDTVTSPNMNLPIPVQGVDTGPDYALNINACLMTLDSHTHASGSGIPVTPAGLNISSDLTFGNNNATNLKSTRFTPQLSVLAGGSDLDCLYVVGVDLYYNDGNGNHVRMTQSGGVAGSPGSISNLTSPASAAYVSANQTFVWQSDSNTPANLDAASIILRNLTANSKGLTLSPPNAMGADYGLTLPSLPGATSFMTLSAAGAIAAGPALSLGIDTANIAANAITTAKIADSNVTTAKINDAAVTTVKIADSNVTTAKIADANVTAAKIAAVNYGVSSSSGAFSTSSTSAVDVTNLSVTLTTTGRPVAIQLQPDGSDGTFGTASTLKATRSSTTPDVQFLLLRDGSIIAAWHIGGSVGGASSVSNDIPVSAISYFDSAPSATSHTYKIQALCGSSSSAFCSYAKLVVREIY